MSRQDERPSAFRLAEIREMRERSTPGIWLLDEDEDHAAVRTWKNITAVRKDGPGDVVMIGANSSDLMLAIFAHTHILPILDDLARYKAALEAIRDAPANDHKACYAIATTALSIP